MDRPHFEQKSAKKQITLIVELADWQSLTREAARRRLSLTELCRREIAPLLNRLSLPASSSESPGTSTALDPAQPDPPQDSLPPPRNPPHHPWRQPFSRSVNAQEHPPKE